MKKRVLHLDDDREIRETVAEVLTEAGYEVESVGGATSAFRSARFGGFDLLLLDLMLNEEQTGVDVVNNLFRGGWYIPPVVVLTAYGPDFVRTAFPLGAPNVLRKPFTSEDLLSIVARLTGTRRLA